MGYLSPLASRVHEVQECVEQFPFAVFALSHPHEEWLYLGPLLVCQISWVRLPIRFIRFHSCIILILPYENSFLEELALYSANLELFQR